MFADAVVSANIVAEENNVQLNAPAKENSVLEEKLIASAKCGDDSAFEALANSYKRVLELHIKHFSPHPSLYDDLFQEGLIGLMKAVRSYDGKSSSFATFASLCVKNSIISGIRKYSGQTQRTVNIDNSLSEEETSPSAEEVLLDSVRVQMLYDKVAEALSPYEKTVFDMYLSDMSNESIAFVTGKSVKSTSNALFRIRQKLKQIIGNPEAFVEVNSNKARKG